MNTRVVWVIKSQNLYVVTMGMSVANFIDAKFFDNLRAARAFAKRYGMGDVTYYQVELKGSVLGESM